MALAVVYAMLASYAISRTLVPILAALLLKGEERQATARAAAGLPPSAPRTISEAAFDQKFREDYADSYEATLTGPARQRLEGAGTGAGIASGRWYARSSGSVRTSSLPWTPVSSACTFARLPDRGSR